MVKYRCRLCREIFSVRSNEPFCVDFICPACLGEPTKIVRTGPETFRPAIPFEVVREEPSARKSWTRLIMEKLLPALLDQRRDLIQTQNEASEQVAAIEQRIASVQAKYQRRLSFLEERVAKLEAENKSLSQQVRQIAEPEIVPFSAGRVNLRDAGFLMRS